MWSWASQWSTALFSCTKLSENWATKRFSSSKEMLLNSIRWSEITLTQRIMSSGDRAPQDSPVCAWTPSVSYPTTSETSASKKCSSAQAPVEKLSSVVGTKTASEQATNNSTQSCPNFVESARKRTLISRKEISNAVLLITRVTGLPRKNFPRPWQTASQVTPIRTLRSNFKSLESVSSQFVISQWMQISLSEHMLTSAEVVYRTLKE